MEEEKILNVTQLGVVDKLQNEDVILLIRDTGNGKQCFQIKGFDFRGESAYEVAQSQGFVGTYQDWQAELGKTIQVSAAVDAANKATLAANTAANNANTAADAAKKATTKATDAADSVKSLLDAFASTNPYCGFARQNGAASGDAETTYGTKSLIHEIGKHFHLMTVKNGEIQHTAVGGRLTKATNGDTIAIDGTDGDVMLGVDMEGLQLIKATKTVDDKETNLIGIGLLPAYWQNVASKKLVKFAITPVETVNCKLEGDVRSQAHCVYNKSAIGEFKTPSGIFKSSYKTSGGGYPSQYVSCINSIRNAQNKNDDALTNRPFTGMYYEFYEALLVLFFAEIGSLKHTTLNMFGTGLTSTEIVSDSTFYDDAISAVSGWKILTTTPQYQNVWGNEAITVGSTNYSLVTGIAGNSYYGVVECLEGQRVLDGIAKAGLVSKIGNKANIFYFDDSNNIVCSSDGSINPASGTGMITNKHYYIVRDVPNCEGMADGVMTAVVNSYTKMEFVDGAKLTSGNVELTNRVAILKRSIPLYRGFTLPYVGLFRQMDGAFLVAKVDSNNNISIEFRCAEKFDDIKARKSFGYEAAVDGEADIEKGLSLVYKYPSRMSGENWITKCNYNLSLFCATSTGGSARTYENMYMWFRDTNNSGKGRRQVHSSVVGCSLHDSARRTSVRSLGGDPPAANQDVYYAGAFAALLV